MSEPAHNDPSHQEPNANPLLIWAEDGSPRSGRFGDVYFSKEDGLAETRAVFLGGCGLPEAWTDQPDFTVGELGFGTGLSMIALIDLWRRQGPDQGWLNLFSVEAFPLTKAEAERALAAWPEVADTAQALLDQWPSGTPGFHRIDLAQWRINLDLAIGDVVWALDQWSGQADAWFLDGFAPSLNPGMWSEPVMHALRQKTAPSGRVASFTVAGLVRRGLADQGFEVEKKPGFGRKRERLEARLPSPSFKSRKPRSIAVIGGGIAGASVIRALKVLGADLVLIEATQPGSGASGFPAALVTPRMDAGDRVIADLHAQALTRAGQIYSQVPEAVIAKGVLQIENQDRDRTRFDKIAEQSFWSPGTMTRLSPQALSDYLREPLEKGGLKMAEALAVAPSKILPEFIGSTPHIQAQVDRLAREADQWTLLDKNGELIARAEVVVIAAGWGSAHLLPQLGLAPVAGQADWIEGPQTQPVAWGGYAVPTGQGLLYGATHERGQADTQVSVQATAANLQTLKLTLPGLAHQVEAGSSPKARKAVRATTPDRLPISGPLPGQANLYVLTGLGSRGFCLAPLLAEDLAAQILDHPSPLPMDSQKKLRPMRMKTTDL